MPEKVAKSKALVIVDVQNDFCPGGSLAVDHGEEIVPVINRISGAYPLVVATQDWHPEGHVSFASAHPGKKPFELLELAEEAQILWPDHCIQGSKGAALHPELDTRPIDLIIRKGTSLGLDSYSAFFENDHTTPTGLDFYLRGFHCQELHFAGLATDVCVRASILDAVRLGYSCTLILDAARGVDSPPGSVDKAIDVMREAGVVVAESESLTS